MQVHVLPVPPVLMGFPTPTPKQGWGQNHKEHPGGGEQVSGGGFQGRQKPVWHRGVGPWTPGGPKTILFIWQALGREH